MKIKDHTFSAKPENGFLRMCIDCKHSKVYQADNKRNIWYFCEHHKVPTHYNESCENYEYMAREVKVTKPLSGFQVWIPPKKEGIP